MNDPADRALILGASSGFGAAAARAFAGAGLAVHGVHLDRRSGAARVRELETELRQLGPSVHLYNANAADDARRSEVLAHVSRQVEAHGGRIRVLLHSLAFGSLVPLAPIEEPDAPRPATRKQLDMTMDVMAHSLVHWVRELVERDLFAADARVFALTSAGSHRVLKRYGPVGAAKAALEAHVRQLAVELAPRRITVNALMAGVTDTPALRKIPGHEAVMEAARKRNPNGRLTRPADVASAMVALMAPGAHWITGNVLRVDGGEDIVA
ncbi:MAG: SDR family oxidoreductase [Myxococcota bacterium]|nr:SDR family oxidoreductase [Myxococcota bacterium]